VDIAFVSSSSHGEVRHRQIQPFMLAVAKPPILGQGRGLMRGVLGEGQPPFSPPARGLGSAVNSPSRVRAEPQLLKGFFYILEAPDGLSWNMLGVKLGAIT